MGNISPRNSRKTLTKCLGLNRSVSDTQLLSYPGRSPFDPIIRPKWSAERRQPLTLGELLEEDKSKILQPESLLHMACRISDAEAIRELATYANINTEDNIGGKTPLQLILEGDRWEEEPNILTMFVSLNADVDKRAEDGWSIVHSACLYGDMRLLNALVSQGADVNDATSTGLTPLHISCHRQDPQFIEVLLRQGADALVETVGGTSPLDFVMKHEWDDWRHQLSALKLVAAAGGDRHGGSPLHVACAWKDARLVRHLLQAGGDRKARDGRDMTAVDVVNCLNEADKQKSQILRLFETSTACAE